MSNSINTDVLIIGTGPVGLFSVFQCGMMNLTCHSVDALDHVGGQCIALYPEKPIYDIPACPGILAADLIGKLEEQIKPFNPNFHLKQTVTHIEKVESGNWKVITSKGKEFNAKTILIAAGVGAFGPNKPPLDGIEQYEGKSIFYYVKNREKFRGKKIVIAGGGDSAIDWALSLKDIAEKVYIVHRRDKFRALPASITALNKADERNEIEKVIPYQLKSINGDGKNLESVVVETLSGKKRTLEADFLLPFFGLSTNLGPISDWELGVKKSHIEIDPLTGMTNRDGIYAIGDIATYPPKLKLIMTGFSESAQATHAIRSYIHPNEVFHFEHSTTMGMPNVEKSNISILNSPDTKENPEKEIRLPLRA
jgi:thioredoxin reductase (NADPH)